MLAIASSYQQERYVIPPQKIITSSTLRKLSVGYQDQCFFIEFPSGKRKDIQKYDLYGGLEFVSSKSALEKIIQVGKIYLTAIGKDYKLRLSVSGKGGGPIYGSIAYWGAKTLFYSGVGYVMEADESIAGAAAGSALSALTGHDMITQVVSGALAGGLIKSLRGLPRSSGEVPTKVTIIKETVVMAGNVAVIEYMAGIISTFFTLFPFCP